ncbi:MAG: hypothetical protein ACRDT2_04070 [Natronosporangium sp.]
MTGRPKRPASRKWNTFVVYLGLLPFLAILACPVAGVLIVRHELNESRREGQADRARAETMVEQRVLDYALAVVEEGDPDIADHRMEELALDSLIRIQDVQRNPNSPAPLHLIVRSEEAYGGMFAGHRSVVVCYEVLLTALGTDTARYRITPLDTCPPRPAAT